MDRHYSPDWRKMKFPPTETLPSQANANSTANDYSADAASATPSEKFFIEVDNPDSFSLDKVSQLHHNYHLHPLMQLDQLEELAKRLVGKHQCRFIEDEVKLGTPFMLSNDPPPGCTIETIFANIEKQGSWLAIYDVQTDLLYKRFLWEVIGSAEKLVKGKEKIWDVRGFIFMSAPPAITPFHIDRENNFWLQTRGRKKLNLWDRADRDVVPGYVAEEFILYRSLERVRLQPAMESYAKKYDCGPGDGVYFPSTTPHATESETHWTRPGDGVAISIGIVFYTDVTKRTAYVHAANHVLRRLGLTPMNPGQSIWVDRLKYSIGRIAITVMKHFRGFKPPPGF